MGAGYLNTAIRSFPDHLLSAKYCFAMIPVFISGILRSERSRITAAVVSVLAVVIAVKVFVFPSAIITCNILLDEEKYPLNSSWSVEQGDETVSRAWLEIYGDDTAQLLMEFFSDSPNIVTQRDNEGNEYRLKVSLNENKDTIVEEIPRKKE